MASPPFLPSCSQGDSLRWQCRFLVQVRPYVCQVLAIPIGSCTAARHRMPARRTCGLRVGGYLLVHVLRCTAETVDSKPQDRVERLCTSNSAWARPRSLASDFEAMQSLRRLCHDHGFELIRECRPVRNSNFCSAVRISVRTRVRTTAAPLVSMGS